MEYQIITFGCQFNKSDAEKIRTVLNKLNYQEATSEKDADLILVLSCSVRQSAIDRIYGLKNKWEEIRTKRPLITILSGCVLESDKKKMAEFFDFILPINDLQKLPEKLSNLPTYEPDSGLKPRVSGRVRMSRLCRDPRLPYYFKNRSASGQGVPPRRDISILRLPFIPSRQVGTGFGQQHYKLINFLEIHPSYQSKFQAYVPIMTGCNNFCTYCVVPYVRGREVSRPAEKIIKECQELISKGYKEIILLGQNVNSYESKIPSPPTPLPKGEGGPDLSRLCRDLSGPGEGTNENSKLINFSQLLKIIDDIPGNYWLRFVTSHPKDLSDELIKVMAQGRHLTPYLHLPVQSGDNEILKKMNRGYTVGYYKKLIREIRLKISNISISTDIIVGFPGETKKQFENTVKLFKEVKFDMAYIAQYSERAGTAAAKLKDNVSKAEKKRREKELTEVLKKTALACNKKFVGKVVEVLVEKCRNGFCFGKTATFKTVKFLGNENLAGKFVKVKINKVEAFGLSSVFSEKMELKKSH